MGSCCFIELCYWVFDFNLYERSVFIKWLQEGVSENVFGIFFRRLCTTFGGYLVKIYFSKYLICLFK